MATYQPPTEILPKFNEFVFNQANEPEYLDQLVVHKALTETITGLKTFTSNLTINNADTRITAAGTGSGTDGLIILNATDPMLTTLEGKIKAYADTQIQLKVNTSSTQVVLGDLGVGIDGGYNYTNSLYLENHNIGEVSSSTSGTFNIYDVVTTKLMFSVNDTYVKLQAPNSGGGVMEISSDLLKLDAVSNNIGQLYIGGDVAFNTITNVALTTFSVTDGTLTHLAITPLLTTLTNATISNVASTAFSVTDGTLTHLAITPSLTTLTNTTNAVSGTNNTMSAVNSNIISTTGTYTGSSNQMIANGTNTYPNANNLISAIGYGGYNTISALNQSGLGTNNINAWYLNQITTAASFGTNEMSSTGISGSNYIHTSNTNGSNTMLSSGTGGINTLTSSSNTFNGAAVFNDYAGVASAVGIKNSKGINVVNTSTNSTINLNSIPMCAMNQGFYSLIQAVSITNYSAMYSDYPLNTSQDGSFILPFKAFPVAYSLQYDNGTITNVSGTIGMILQLNSLANGTGTQYALTNTNILSSGTSSAFAQAFPLPSPSVVIPANTIFYCSYKWTTTGTTPTAYTKKWIMRVYFAQTS